ncbi:uncharacterized protein BJ212DRAFT_1375158 [Suillus subaureus]|uniref:Uncharacterized protein n=1 Tax=Suillus subaureus TaxID=48587 RepID=A0A9P7JA61_9AGAM|nr:uncharacterized protein BJ212DRAFT_1375158 [Suillus subaureus]KAG1811141.1 hypothetical protein BJ212DRAFT_1375158 [Suillus subaureus]
MTEADAVTLVRDNAAKNFSWYISPGRPMISVRSESSFASRAWMPPRPANTSTEEQSPKHLANWHLLGIRLTRPTLNQCLQSYFRRMQHVMTRICHPLSIHNEACSILHSAKNAGFIEPRLLAEGLFIAGAAQLQYTRTVALLIHDVLIELNMTDWRVMHAVGVHLEEFATSTLVNVFHNFSGDFKKANDTLESLRDQQFNAAALYGDLVSFGIIPHNLFVSVINSFLDDISSISQYRVIYLLILRAIFQDVFPIHPDLLLFPLQIKLRFDDEMIQRWIIVSSYTVVLLDVNILVTVTRKSAT